MWIYLSKVLFLKIHVVKQFENFDNLIILVELSWD